MSMRFWLGDQPKQWADFNLSEYSSMFAMIEDGWYHNPIRAYSPELAQMEVFLSVFEEVSDKSRNDFSQLMIGDEGNWIDYYKVRGTQ